MSLDPDTWVEGGLPSNFVARVAKARYLPHRFRDSDPHKLFVRFHLDVLDPDEAGGKDEIIQFYSAGDLKSFQPSQDGYEPVDIENGEDGSEEVEGVYAFPVGSRKEGSKSTNFADFILNAIKAGLPKSLLVDGDISKLEGLVARFERVPQMERKGSTMEKDPTSKSDGKILAITEIVELPGAGGSKKGSGGSGKAAGGGSSATAAAKAKAGAKSAKVADPDEEEAEEESAVDPLDAKLDEILMEALADNDGEAIEKAALVKLVSSKLGSKDKTAGMARVQQKDYLRDEENRPFVYDAEEAEIKLPD
jgi:hypothetical protein